MASRAIAAANVHSWNVTPRVFAKIRRSVALFLGYAALRATVRTQYLLMHGFPSIVVVVTGGVKVSEAYRKAAELLFMGPLESRPRRAQEQRALVHVLEVPRGNKPKVSNPILEEHGKCDFIIVLARSRSEIPSDLAIAADGIVDLVRPTVEHIHAVRRLLGRRPFGEEAAKIAATLDFSLLVSIASKHSLSEAEARRLVTTVECATADSPFLEDLPGYGPAKVWARGFIADLARVKSGALDWAEMDRGVLLHGPPGTGKTLFARAFARSAGLPLIAASVSLWQSFGHLGDLLGAMRESFEEARAKQPSVLFLDELDSVGDRAKFSGKHVDYSRQVVNFLLECIDGAQGRDQIVVIAATNYPDVIDPALLRSGRIERHIKIELPEADERFEILRYHLRIKDPEDVLRMVAVDLEGWNGADLEMLAREAKQRGRSFQRTVQIDDVVKSLPPLQELSGAQARRVALHEAGHVVATCVLSPGCRVSVSMRKKFHRFDSKQVAPGVTRYEVSDEDHLFQTREDFEDFICRALAGAAAEEHVLGSRSTGFSGSIGSDLETATVTATRMLCSYGLGRSLPFLIETHNVNSTYVLRLPNDLRGEVGRILEQQYSRAKLLVAEHSVALEEIAAELLERGALVADEVASTIARNARAA
ncbi:AAA family ATPase [Agrobacterium burrii]|uniref:AAA family ATPase n=1 Tax=Agrobacterium burrii TaxID=2815339 RepID=A0ABS3EGX1_9HYPH|nr:AAA family ATPase [Agrobacterium burrii]MBO0130903.1 AAA family ATPase [Agrobacterium burrii]